MSSPSQPGSQAVVRVTSGASVVAGLSALLAAIALWPRVSNSSETWSSEIWIEVRQRPGSTPTIVVKTRAGENTYGVAQAAKVPLLLQTRGRCYKIQRPYSASLNVGGQRIDIDAGDWRSSSYSPDGGDAWRTHQVDLPTAELKLAIGGKALAENVSLPQLSPVAMCNQELSKRQGAARKEMLAQGIKIRSGTGLTADFLLRCGYQKDGSSEIIPTRANKVSAAAAVIVHCAPMVAAGTPEVRTQTTTKGASPQTPGKKLPPSIESVKLRVEISQQQRCPDSLRLVGSITAIRATRGEYIFLGNQFLSPKGSYAFDAAGHRNVVATRKLNWEAAPKGLAAAPGAERTMQGWVQLNLQPEVGDKVISSGKVPFKATCKAPAPARATATSATGKRRHMPLRTRAYVDTDTGATEAAKSVDANPVDAQPDDDATGDPPAE